MKSLYLSTAVCSLALFGCGSQQLRLTSPDTAAGVSYTCTAANTCYPASLAIPAEGQPDEALPLVMPRECQGRIHEILIRDADSSSPEIDVTCAGPAAKPDAPAQTAPAPSASSDEPPVVEDSSIGPAP
jgi:hypothetical protein